MNEIIAPKTPSFAALIQCYFTEYLITQRALSSRTIASYRDAIMLFLNFAHTRLGKAPTALELSDINPDLILAFLDYLEQDRHNSVRSRNLRLTALRAFFEICSTKRCFCLLCHRTSVECADETFRVSNAEFSFA